MKKERISEYLNYFTFWLMVVGLCIGIWGLITGRATNPLMTIVFMIAAIILMILSYIRMPKKKK